MPNPASSIFLMGMLAFSPWPLAQTDRGSINGVVSDADHAIVPGAPIQVKNGQTGAVYKTTSSSTGNYTLEQLPPGTYDLFVIMPAFAPYKKPGIVVQAGQELRLDIQLEDTGALNTLGDGRDFFNDIRGVHPVPSGLTPRTPDGKPDFSGVWHALRDADPDAEITAEKPPALPWAAAIAKERTESNGKDSPGVRCLPTSVQLMSLFWLNKVVQTPTLLLIISEGAVPAFRQIFLDGRHPADLDPTWLGYSTGKWEGDTLVVDTIAFNDKAWIAPGNFPHTEKLRMTTRIRRPDLGHLEFETTYDDPGTFTKLWKVRQAADLAPGEEIWEYICNENNQDAEHMVGK
jgi:hypothetical protein